MGSSLRSKLGALSSAAPKKPPLAPTLWEYRSEHEADSGLFRLSPDGIRRMAFYAPLDPARTLFLDTETTGLGGGTGTVAFLVGLGRLEEGKFVVYQYLMPHYGCEALLLDRVSRFIGECDTLVTFNGRSFDMPLLRSRFVMCRMADPSAGKAHLDLIHPARRAWKLRLKDCSLGHIEQSIMGLTREGDLPGAEVPERYFSFLKTGDMRLLEDVITHNRQDIVSLGTLLVKLSGAYAAPAEQLSMRDVFSLGRVLERQGECAEAGKCYRLAARERPLSTMERLTERHVAGSANKSLSLMLRTRGEREEAEGIWHDMIARGQMGTFPYVELAKLYEHARGEPERALRMTEAALAIAPEDEKAALKKRQARLAARIERRENKCSGGI